MGNCNKFVGDTIKEVIKKYANKKVTRYFLMIFSVVMIFMVGMVGIEFSGRVTEISQEDIELIIYYLIEILKITLGYLVGRGFRYIFEK